MKRYLICFLLLLSPAANALDFSGTRLDLNPRRLVAELIVTLPANSAPQQYEAKLNSWQVLAGQDVTLPSDELVLVPRRFELQPGVPKTLLVGLLSPSHLPKLKEATYRILLKPLSQQEQGVGVSVGYSIPVFVASQKVGGPIVELALTENPNGAPILRISNSGISHSVVQGLRLVASQLELGDGRFYLLADSYRDVLLSGLWSDSACLQLEIKRLGTWEAHQACRPSAP